VCTGPFLMNISFSLDRYDVLAFLVGVLLMNMFLEYVNSRYGR
jgi:hypothetical protein